MDDGRDEGTRALAQLVGGLLLGAAAAALVQFLVPLGPAQPAAALGGALLVGLLGAALERRVAPGSGTPAFAAARVLAGSLPFFASTAPRLSALAVALVAAVSLTRAGRGPLGLVALVALFTSGRHATQVDLAGHAGVPSALAFLALLVAYGALLAARPRGRWRSAALGAHVLALSLAAFPLLDAIGVTDAGIAALAIGALLAALFAVGVALDERAVVVLTGALLGCAAVGLAFLALGPALAAVILLMGGCAILWRAGALRGYLSASQP